MHGIVVSFGRVSVAKKIRVVKFKFILFVLLIAPVWVQAQTCNLKLTGTVTDSYDGEKLEFAALGLLQVQKQAFTKSDGTFEFTNLCPGTYSIVCRHLGCKDTTISVTITQNTNISIVMPHKLNQIKEVDIKGERGHGESQANSMAIVSVLWKDLVPLLGGTLGDIVKTMPGVTVLQTGATIGKPVVNGFSGNRIVIMNNGVRLEGQQWGGEHAPEVDPNLSNIITVWYGARAVRFGPDAIGGVITLDAPRLPYGKKFGGNTNLAGYSNNRMGVASAQIESGFGKNWAWRLQGTYRKGANVFTPNYGLDNTALREGDFSGSIGYKNEKWKVEAYVSRFDTKIGIFKGAHIGNLSDLQQAISSTVPFYTTNSHTYAFNRPYQHVVHYTGKLNVRYYINDANTLTFQYAAQNNSRAEYDKDKPLNDSLAALNRPEFLFNLSTHTVDATYNYHSDEWDIMAGITGMQQSNVWDGRYFIPNFRAFNTGAFTTAEYTRNHWSFEAGLRYDIRFLQIFRNIGGNIVSPKYTFQNPSASVMVKYKDLLPGLSVGSWLGMAWRPPTVSELYSNGLHHGAAAYEIGDTSFTAEVGYNANAYVYYEKEGIEFRALFHYTYFDNYINLEPVLPPTLTISGAFPTFKYRQVQATYTSLNFSLSVDVTKGLCLFTRNTMLWAYNLSAKQFLLTAPPHRFQLGARYEFNDKKWFEHPYIEVLGSHTTRQYLVDPALDYSPPPAAYTLLNIEAGFTAHIRNTHFTVSIAAANLLNTSYRDYLDRFRYFTDAMGRNFSIKLHIPFGSSDY